MTSRRWDREFSGAGTWKGSEFQYAIGWDRLRNYEDLYGKRMPAGHLWCINVSVPDGFWNAELRLLEARGNVSVIVSRRCQATHLPRHDSRNVAVKRYEPKEDVHLHIKADLMEAGRASLFRVSSAHLMTRRLGPLVLGMRGFGRTEMFFSTNHPGVLTEARDLVARLEANELPRSGTYFRFESPVESSIHPSICADILDLVPGTGSIVHCSATCSDRLLAPGRQSAEGLQALYALLRDHSRHGTQVLVAYGEFDRRLAARLWRHAAAGSRVGVPRYCPGSFMAPYGLTRWLRRIPGVREFRFLEHFNVTIVGGLRDATSGQQYAVVYLGHKSDFPYDARTLELMVRCDSREFPGLCEAATALIASRLEEYGPGEFTAAFAGRER